MNGESIRVGRGRVDVGRWATGACAGAVGAAVASIVLFAAGTADPAEVGVEALGVLLVPGAVFGLLYAGLASLPRVATYASRPRTGVLVGAGYGVLFWTTTVAGGGISGGVFVACLAFGTVVGVLYAVSPYRA